VPLIFLFKEIYELVNKKIEKEGELSNEEINEVLHDNRLKKTSFEV
jgi:hypothetical protein